MSSRLLVVVTGSLVLGVLAAACGGAESAPAKAPAQEATPGPNADAVKEESDPKTVQEAQDRIARAQSELSGGAGGGATSATPTTPGTSSERPSSTTAPRAEPKVDRPGGDVCASSCRALASMRRAVNALCKMTGDGDTRCSDARRTLADNESKVTPTCKCQG